jgi:pilus assembly protein Flp/PilA
MEEQMSTDSSHFANDESGATSIEYALIASLVALVLIVSLNALGDSLTSRFTAVAAAFN